MSEKPFPVWLSENSSKFSNLTNVAVTILTSILDEAGIDYLAITGRTKTIDACIEKQKRKGYFSPEIEMMDISGVRVVLFLEQDISRVSDIVEDCFKVDHVNSENKDKLLSSDKLGYRSIHYVCELGEDRRFLREYVGLHGLRFEIQIRTILQHAWASFTHDRNYKFSGKLPFAIERKLNLLAGLLETADTGFNELSKSIESYQAEVVSNTRSDATRVEINSISLDQFAREWAKEHNVVLERVQDVRLYDEVIKEMKAFGLRNLGDVKLIEPQNYVQLFEERETNAIGMFRDWMLIANPEKMCRDLRVTWTVTDDDADFLSKYLTIDQMKMVMNALGIELPYEPEGGYVFDDIDDDDPINE